MKTDFCFDGNKEGKLLFVKSFHDCCIYSHACVLKLLHGTMPYTLLYSRIRRIFQTVAIDIQLFSSRFNLL
jgi:hypothetical protein